ncbi:TonB-dependent receptor [Povalibacter uvarum]|uniref:TonB-dependent receptor n=1 Tax=Povalibacter uvarum TaxID=732238 RepID=A0A841HQI6_9GAMM|nr:TonB-dependent receptor [Povalibacter uvarum]MBB6095477.1 TonB-dependent receptor [Povalibacter uvarum]
MDKSKQGRWRLGAGMSVCAVAALVQSAAFAQEAKPASTPASTELEEVIVTGIRAGLRSSLEAKRDSIQVVDAISAEDIGDFPDKNVSEALQRVTGVQISRQDGEGRGVSIRGADPSLNRVEINGSSALSMTVGGGRDVDFRDIPVEFISRLEVVKSATPEMTEGGIGGTVRVITRRPFDAVGGFLAGSAQMVYSDLADEYDPKFALIGSRTFFNDTLGVLLSATYEERNLDSNNARTTGWIRRDPNARNAQGALINPPGRHTDINGDGTPEWIPEIPRYIIDRRETKRPAFNGVVEWRPSEDFSMFAEGTYTEAKEEVSSMLMQLSGSSGIIDYANTVVGPDNTIEHIEITSGAIGTTQFPVDLAYRNINGTLKRDQYTTAVGAKYEIGSFVLDGRVAYANAEVQNDEKNSTATIFGVPRAIIDYTGGEGAPNFTFPGLDTTTGQLVNQLAAVFNPRTNTQDETSGEFNVEFKPDLAWMPSVKAGYRHSDLTMDSILYQRTIQLSSRTPLPASSGGTRTIAASQATIAGIIDANSGVNSIQFFETGDLGFGGGVRYWNDNGDATYDATVAASGVPGGLDPYGVNTNPNTNGTFQNYLDTWSVDEKTNAAYLQASFEFELGVPVSTTLGVRYVDTDTLSSGYNRVQTGSGASQVVTFPQAEQAGGYAKWLPSLNMKINLTDELVGRVTAGKVMARPNPSQLALRRSTDLVGLTGSRGNPNLQPFEATQYDLGLDWYFSDVSYVSATLFRKEISQFIINTATPEDVDGTIYTIIVPVNGNDAVTITGVEAGGQYAFDFLPEPFNGFGVLANVTYSDDEGFKGTNLLTGELLPFPGLSELSYNASIYFEGEQFSVRTSYNWREEWLITAAGRGSLPEFNEDYGSLDASASFSFTPNFTVFAEAINLLDEQRIENNNPYRRIGNETFGKRYFVGLRGKF